MKLTPESVIQQSIVIWFQNTYCLKHHEPSYLIYSVPNGISLPLPIKEMARALDLMNKTGMLKGASDLIIQGLNGRVINVEVKKETGKQSHAQIVFQNKVEALGGVYILVRSLEEFKEKINCLLGN